MEWIETSGRTVAEAIEAALDHLGVDEHDAEVIVVAEAKAGIFGFRQSDARVRARVRPSQARPKRPRRNRNDRGQRSGTASAGSGEKRDRTPSAKTTKAPSKASAGARNGKRPRQATNGSTGQEEPMTVEQEMEILRKFVEGVVTAFGYDAKTELRAEDDHIFVDVTGADLGLLIGPRGSAISALQELARTAVQRQSDEPPSRVIVDVGGFRARRAAALESFARKIADEVLQSGAPHSLEPMGAPDRKIVHDTINSIDGVATTSEGVEPRRYVVVRPAVIEASTPEASAALDELGAED